MNPSSLSLTLLCVSVMMSNHFHILLEVPPIPEGGFSDEEDWSA